MTRFTYRSEYIRCGKAGCRKCPHGPYWYAYWKESGKTRKKYCGKTRPVEEPAEQPAELGDRRDDIFDSRRASMGLAWEIIGMERSTDQASVKRRFRELMLKHHPDRGGDEKEAKRISAAWSYLCKLYDWS